MTALAIGGTFVFGAFFGYVCSRLCIYFIGRRLAKIDPALLEMIQRYVEKHGL